jgi:GNAT superfamily N-acetyltransferase
MPTPDEKLLALSDLNLAESHREQARWLPPTRIHENEEALYTASGTRFPAGPFNCAVGIGASACDARVFLDGTLPDARGRGHAERIMRSLCNRAFDRGARAVVLQASPFGEPVYRRLGYQEITRYPWFLASKEQARAS